MQGFQRIRLTTIWPVSFGTMARWAPFGTRTIATLPPKKPGIRVAQVTAGSRCYTSRPFRSQAAAHCAASIRAAAAPLTRDLEGAPRRPVAHPLGGASAARLPRGRAPLSLWRPPCRARFRDREEDREGDPGAPGPADHRPARCARLDFRGMRRRPLAGRLTGAAANAALTAAGQLCAYALISPCAAECSAPPPRSGS